MFSILLHIFLMMFLSLQLFASDNLCINLMFLNAQAVHDTMFPRDKTYGEDAREQVKKWLELNPEAHTNVQFWYDGSKVAPTVAARELVAFNAQLSDSEKPRFALKDMRTVDAVKNEYSLFFQENVPIYFQTDILRFILAEAQLKSSECDVYIYADLNVQPESRADLFDERTRGFLDEYGIVMMRHHFVDHPGGGAMGFENKFMMLRNDSDLLQAMHQALFKPLKSGLPQYIIHRKSDLNQIVYDLIPNLFLNLFHRKNKILIENFDALFNEYAVDSSNPKLSFYGTVGISDPDHPNKKYTGTDLIYLTRVYYYTDLEKDMRVTARLKDIRDRTARGMKSTQESIQSIRNKLANEVIEKRINALKRELAELEEENADLEKENKRSDEEIKRDLKADFQQQWDDYNWPKNLPIPAKIMVAPRSHFG